ncbi:MAG: tetratricopeptide repeat protein [Sedimentisphaerales bacterium]|nr:tetratricopeptide repeat protein [Sedimentisphaerales bacterium]
MRTRIHFVVAILASILVFGPSQRVFADAKDDLEQARAYEEKGQYEQAEQLYKAIVAWQAGSDYGLQAQKQLVCLYIATNRLVEADTALGELIADFSAQEGLAQAVHDIAYRYRGADKNDKANELDQYVIDAWPQSDCALLGQMDIAKYYVDRGMNPNAQAATDVLLRDFSDHPLISRAVHDVAQHYRWSGKYEKANELYKCVTANWPDSEHALWSQADLIKSYLAAGDEANAEAAVEGLLTGFADSPLIARAAWDTAQCFGEHKKYAEAIRLYQHITANWPDSEHGLKAQMDLVKTYLTLKDDAGAGAAIGGLVGNFSKNPGAARAVWEIGQYCRELKKYSQANVLYKHVVANWPDSEDALWSQADLIKSYLAAGDDPNAEIAVVKLLSEFSDNSLIARAVHDTAYEYRKLEKYDKADQLDQLVIDSWPEAEQAIWAKMDMAKTNVALGNDAAVEAAIDAIIVEYSDNPHLARVVFTLGEEYYNKAYAKENEGLSKEAKNYFSTAIAIFQKVITELTPHETYTGYAQHLLNDCYRRFGDKYCGAYVVWHTLNHYGLTKPIEFIVKEMQLDKSDSVSIYELVATLKENGISARAVKFELDKMAKIDKPFVQYISPTSAREFGHFILCIPTGSGKAVTLDGAEEPKLIDLAFSQEDTYQQTRWDGTSILIYGAEAEIRDDAESAILNLDILRQLAADWLENEGGESPLSLDLQVALYGGCPDDCKTTSTTCFNAPLCERDVDCEEFEEDYGCYDSTVEELCKTPGSWPDCVYDSGHKCNPRRKVSGMCNLSKGYCKPTTTDFGECKLGDEHPPDLAWVRQCHY